MHLCHVSAGYYPFVGGAQTYLQAMSERCARAGHDVAVFTTNAAQVDCFWKPDAPRVVSGIDPLNGVRVQRCALGYLPGAPLSFYLLRRAAPILSQLPRVSRAALNALAPWMPRVPDLARALEQQSPPPDLVHGVNIALEWPLVSAGRYARRRRIPFVATPFVHIGAAEVQRNYTMRHQVDALIASDAVLVQTPLEGRALAGLGVPEQRIHCLGMGVDLDEVQGGDAHRFRRQHAVSGPSVLFMGTLTYDKGVTHLCDAMQLLWAQGIEATLVLAGKAIAPGGFDDYYRRLPADARARIRLLGQVAGELKKDALAAADVFAMPSRVDSFGIVYLEAWACNVPVIGARAGGVPAVIDDGRDGLLVEFGDAGGLARALRSLLEDEPRRRAMGAQGRAKVVARYTWELIWQKLCQVYDEIRAANQA